MCLNMSAHIIYSSFFNHLADCMFTKSNIKSFATATQENVDALINCVVKNIGFSQGKPIAAFTIYKCLLHWKSFEAERTSVFDRLIQMIGSEIEVKKIKESPVHGS